MKDGFVIDRVRRDSQFDMPDRHIHSEYELYFLLEGSRYYFIENKKYLIKKGSLVLINRHQLHKTTATDLPFHDRILTEINDGVFSEQVERIIGYPLDTFFATHYGVWELNEQESKYVEDILFSIINELREKDKHHNIMSIMRFAELLIFIDRFDRRKAADFETDMKYTKINEISTYIYSHSSEDISLATLAKQFYINKSYLSRIFKEVTGFTVNEYINTNRILNAQKLLSERSDLNITLIAYSVGYNSITYFERMFMRYTETTPMKYRKKVELMHQKLRDRRKEEFTYEAEQ
jgi:AraC-like DNA-binding protein